MNIEVLPNSHPEFVTEPETAFSVAVDETYVYQLPEVVDREENDESEVVIGSVPDEEENYPSFLTYDFETRTITLAPN